MDRTDVLRIMGVLKAAYPGYYRDMGAREANSVVALWEEMLQEDDPQVVALAVKAHIANDKKGFPPHIGAVKDAVAKLTAPEEMTEQEAWQLVARACRNGTYGAQREFDALPPVVQRLVGSPNQLREWATMDSHELQTVVASNFQRSYRARAAHEREYLALPRDVRQAMESLAKAFEVPGLADKKGEST